MLIPEPCGQPGWVATGHASLRPSVSIRKGQLLPGKVPSHRQVPEGQAGPIATLAHPPRRGCPSGQTLQPRVTVHVPPCDLAPWPLETGSQVGSGSPSSKLLSVLRPRLLRLPWVGLTAHAPGHTVVPHTQVPRESRWHQDQGRSRPQQWWPLTTRGLQAPRFPGHLLGRRRPGTRGRKAKVPCGRAGVLPPTPGLADGVTPRLESEVSTQHAELRGMGLRASQPCRVLRFLFCHRGWSPVPRSPALGICR